MGKQLLVLNDIHLGVQRTAGTTPASATALRSWLHDTHSTFIMRDEFANHDLVYNGDVFDAFQVPLADAARLVQAWVVWLESRPGNIHVGRGNHDISKDSSKVSIFDFVCETMQTMYPTRFFPHTAFGKIDDNVYILPHCTNQEEFNAELARAVETLSDAILLLHANYDNPFAENSDHSLSVSVEQARAFSQKNVALLFGHEHDHKTHPGLGVWITGNQFPTSIADLIQGDTKYYAEIYNGTITMVQMPHDDHLFQVVDWKDIDSLTEYGRFIKIVGDVTAEDNVKVVEAVAALRAQAVDSFVVSNGVHVEEAGGIGAMQVTGEEIRAVNIFDFLYGQLEPEQAETIRALLKDRNET